MQTSALCKAPLAVKINNSETQTRPSEAIKRAGHALPGSLPRSFTAVWKRLPASNASDRSSLCPSFCPPNIEDQRLQLADAAHLQVQRGRGCSQHGSRHARHSRRAWRVRSP